MTCAVHKRAFSVRNPLCGILRTAAKLRPFSILLRQILFHLLLRRKNAGVRNRRRVCDAVGLNQSEMTSRNIFQKISHPANRWQGG
jgi:hypothetical protein